MVSKFYNDNAERYRLLAEDLRAEMLCIGRDTKSGSFKRVELQDKHDNRVADAIFYFLLAMFCKSNFVCLIFSGSGLLC